MERSLRISRINALLSRPRGASLNEIIQDLEVSRATVNRDLQLMREQMNAPIVWDNFDRAYRLEKTSTVGDTKMLPGLWLAPAQAYALLTLNNMVEKIAPNVLGPFLTPMRGLLKQMLCGGPVPMVGLDRKIEIDMPDMPAINDLDFTNLIDALMHEQAVVFEMETKSGLKHSLSGVPTKLRITANGWSVDVQHRASGDQVTIDVADIRKVLEAGERRS